MFIPIKFASVNGESDVAPGTYTSQCTGYGGRAGEASAFLFGYTPAGAATPTVYDLVVLDPGGDIRAADYVQLADLGWRDSNGCKAEEFGSLLPSELEELAQTTEQALPDVQAPRDFKGFVSVAGAE